MERARGNEEEDLIWKGEGGGGEDVCAVRWEGCDYPLSLRKVGKGGDVWVVEGTGGPDRYVRLFAPSALDVIVRQYAYAGEECHKKGGVVYGCRKEGEGGGEEEVGDSEPLPFLLPFLGVGQERPGQSGLCWWSSLCFCLCCTEQMRSVFASRLPPHVSPLVSSCLDKDESARKLRRFLFSTYAIGDDPDQDPSLDGKNAGWELCVLAAQLGLPLIRFEAPSMTQLEDEVEDQRGKSHSLRRPFWTESSLLVVQCLRSAWEPKRRIKVGGRRYKLAAVLLGSETCGHQISMSTIDMDARRWAISDADARSRGIGPIHWEVRRGTMKDVWLKAMHDSVPLSVGGAKTCSFSPPLERKRGGANADYVYLSLRKDVSERPPS